jgi:hypothetical protein
MSSITRSSKILTAPVVRPSVLVEVRVVVAAICDILAASEDSPLMESNWGLVMCVGMS